MFDFIKIVIQICPFIYNHSAQDYKQRNQEKINAFNDWLSYNRASNLQGHCWYTIRLCFPIKNFDNKRGFDSNHIKQLKKVIENHEINGKKIWLQ